MLCSMSLEQKEQNKEVLSRFLPRRYSNPSPIPEPPRKRAGYYRFGYLGLLNSGCTILGLICFDIFGE